VVAEAKGQQSPYLPLSAEIAGSGSASVVRIVYSEPGTLGLLDSSGP
jgi:hypothetical protein